MARVSGRCGPRHRSFQHTSPVAGVQVVVDGELPRTNFDTGSFGGLGRAALELDELQLVRLVSEFCSSVLVGDGTPGEALALLDDLLHPLFDAFEIVRSERLSDVEVVVEAVLDRRADTQLGFGEQFLDGLGEHVGARVAQDRASLFRVDADFLHHIAVGELVGEVSRLPVDQRGDHGSPVRF